MSRSLDLEMPEGFIKRVHQALRAYHAQHSEDVLDDILLARQIEVARGAAPPRWISNQILIEGLDRLKELDGEAATLLQRRFLNEETALEVAYSQNLSEDVIFQRQRVAIARLAQVVWNQENELRQRQTRRIEARLEPPTYSRLFGVADKIAQLRAVLETAAEPWLVAIEGLGGIGKTTLVDALARELAVRTSFVEVGWVSARRRLFRLQGDIDSTALQPALTLAELIDRLVDQFELAGLKRQADADKAAGLKDFLRSRPCLVIVDNLETVADYDALVSQLTGLVNPTKFLITTRYSLRSVSGVYTVMLRQLSREDTFALIQHEARTRGLDDLADSSPNDLEQIYHVTGGNPLATKLLIGQIHTLSLPTALACFSAARGRPVEELLTYIYDQAWQLLDHDSRRVLRVMLLVADEGGRLEQIAAASEMDRSQIATCLQRLATLSLVNVDGSLKERRYSLHQLTQTFVARQMLDDSE